ncbi:MAG: pantoate--beta-alanine ligase [bacterium]|nr:pantoate--beta-alanine ligase [bacterium]
MNIIQSAHEMQKKSLQLKREGKTLGFVPTMGHLHEGHLALVDAARREADVVVMSLFVNPTQFGPGEDFEQYPRDLERDAKMAKEGGVDVLFDPEAVEVYPEGDQSTVLVTELTRGLCGPFRPGHFRGVTTVVAKLLLMVQPDILVLGEKDFQQLVVLKRMIKDLHFPVRVLGVPTLREEGGLAMSSRNSYLSPEERQEALNIFRGLQRAQKILHSGERSVSALLEGAREVMGSGGGIQIEYLEIVDPQTLEPLTRVDAEARILTAVRLNEKRLIDNLPLIP